MRPSSPAGRAGGPLLALLAAASAPAAAAPQAWIEDHYAIDPETPPRATVVGHREVLAACAGVRALRDAAMACPLDHQLALRGLPALAEVCAETAGGMAPPGGAFPVPHPVTLSAAAEAAAALATRLGAACGYQLEAAKVGDELQIRAPADSGAVELRLGWHPSELDTVRWLQPLHGEAPAAGLVTRTVPLGTIRPEGGVRAFDLSVEILDKDGAAPRVRLPVELRPELEAPLLGPILEVAVGTAQGVRPLTDLAMPPVDEAALARALPRPTLPDPLDLVGRPAAGSGEDRAGLRAASRACRDTAARALAPRLCAWFTGPDASGRRPERFEAPVLAAAARDDLVAFARNLGESILYTELSRPAAEVSWMRLDGAAALAAVGGMVEAVLGGTPPRSAVAGWARQRPPVLPDGRQMGLYSAEGVVATPVSALLYTASLIVASGPEDTVELSTLATGLPTVPGVRADAPTGAGAIAVAANLSRPENLPAGVSVPWTGAARPMAGAAELGWIRELAARLLSRAARASADNAVSSAIPGDDRAASRARGAGRRLAEAIHDGVVLASALPANDVALAGAAPTEAVHSLARAGEDLVARLGGDAPAAAAAEAGRIVVGEELGDRFVAPPPGTFSVAALLARLTGA